MNDLFLADIVAIIHLGYVVFVILGFVFIVVGIFSRWKWIRNPWFRVPHLAAIVAVAMEAILGLHCPLTVLEFRLRYPSGPVQGRFSFIGTLIDSILFYDAPGWVFTLVYIAFATIVVITFIMAPPRGKGPQPKELR